MLHQACIHVVFRDIRDKNAVNRGFWSKTTVFSLPATKMHGFHTCTYLLQPGSRKQHKYTSIHEYRYWGLRTEDRWLRIEDWGPRTEDWGVRIEKLRIENWELRSEEWGQPHTYWGHLGWPRSPHKFFWSSLAANQLTTTCASLAVTIFLCCLDVEI